MGNRRCCGNHNQGNNVVTSPTETITNIRTNTRTIKHIHPTEVVNVNRTVIRNEHYYPVTEREANETIVEDINCGTNPNQGCRQNSNSSNCNQTRGRKKRCRPFWEM